MGLAEVRLQEGESLENALRRFKRKLWRESVPEKRFAESQIRLPQMGSLRQDPKKPTAFVRGWWGLELRKQWAHQGL